MRLMIGPIVTCAWWLGEVRCQNSQHEGSWQGVFMVNNESAVRTWKKKCAYKFTDWFSSLTPPIAADALLSIPQSSRLWVLASEQIRKSWNSQKKKKLHTRSVAIQVQAFWRTPEKLTSFVNSSGESKICSLISKFRIVHAQHKQQKLLLFKVALRSLFTISRAHSLLSWAMSHVWPVNTLFQIWLITNCKRN